MTDIYTFVMTRSRKFFDILPNDKTSPSGNENNSVSTNISTVQTSPDANCPSIVKIFISHSSYENETVCKSFYADETGQMIPPRFIIFLMKHCLSVPIYQQSHQMYRLPSFQIRLLPQYFSTHHFQVKILHHTVLLPNILLK